MQYVVILSCFAFDHICVPDATYTEIYVGIVVNVDFIGFSALFKKFLFIFFAIKA